VNISSVRGLFDTGREGVMAYSAAKAALNSFTKTLAKALAPNVTVNAILPGFTATTYLERAPAEQVAVWKESSAIERFIEPSEIADITISVAENKAITGSLVLVDGGARVTAWLRWAGAQRGPARVISADMVALSNHMHVRFAPNRYRDVAAQRLRDLNYSITSSARPAGGKVHQSRAPSLF
jgi:hypothetical protein